MNMKRDIMPKSITDNHMNQSISQELHNFISYTSIEQASRTEMNFFHLSNIVLNKNSVNLSIVKSKRNGK